jgi:hypothetical protein
MYALNVIYVWFGELEASFENTERGARWVENVNEIS